MLASELIGKKAIRTTHTVMAGGNICRSFMSEPVLILKVTDSHIVCKWLDGIISKSKNSDAIHILPYEYCDDNWVDYDELIKGI